MALRTRVNEKGYREFLDPSTGQWVPVHRRVAEKKEGELPEGAQVHHRNGNKLDNRWCNITVVTPRIHGRLHYKPGACERCGRTGHQRADCYAVRDYKGNWLPSGRRR